MEPWVSDPKALRGWHADIDAPAGVPHPFSAAASATIPADQCRRGCDGYAGAYSAT